MKIFGQIKDYIKNIISKISIYDILLFTVLGAVLIKELSMLGMHRMHMDECLYSNWAQQIISGRDILLHKTVTDKFPLISYIVSFFMFLFGDNDSVTRIPGIIVSIVTIYFVYKLSLKIFNKASGIISILIAVFSSYFICFGPTVFTDMYLACFLIISLYLIFTENYKLSGFFLGLAVMAKLTGLMFLPVYMLAIYMFAGKKNNNANKKALMDFLKAFGIMFLIIFLWAALIEVNAFKLFMNNSPINSKNLLNFENFGQQIILINNLHLYSVGWMKIIISVIGPAILFFSSTKLKKMRIFFVIMIIWFYIVLFIMILRGMPFYDRYLIPILPFIYIILGDCLYGSFEIIKNKWAAAIAAGAMFFLIILPVNPQLNTGAYFSENDGIEDTAILVKKSRDPIVYNIGVNSWVLSYYFFNVCKPGSLKNLKPEQSGEIPELDRNSKNDCFILTNPEIQAERAITDKFNAYEKIPVIKSGKLKYLIYKIHSPGRG